MNYSYFFKRFAGFFLKRETSNAKFYLPITQKLLPTPLVYSHINIGLRQGSQSYFYGVPYNNFFSTRGHNRHIAKYFFGGVPNILPGRRGLGAAAPIRRNLTGSGAEPQQGSREQSSQ